MEKKIIAFGASNSKTSINKKLAEFAASQLESVKVQVMDLNDYELPLYSVDLQQEIGIPDSAISFLKEIKNSDGIVISVAEYNGLHTSAFKTFGTGFLELKVKKSGSTNPCSCFLPLLPGGSKIT